MTPLTVANLVPADFPDKVSTKNKTSFQHIGTFDLGFLAELVDILLAETYGEVELSYIPPDKNRTGAGLLLVTYGNKEYAALAGIRTHPVDIEKVDGILIPKQPEGV